MRMSMRRVRRHKTVKRRKCGLNLGIYLWHTLTKSNLPLLTSGEKLIDKHINFAQKILKAKFLKINGLHFTLLQDWPHKESTHSANQIFLIDRITGYVQLPLAHQARRCWFMSYDLGYTKWDEKTLSLLAKCFERWKERGLYAIANATCIAYEKDPCKMSVFLIVSWNYFYSNR